MEALSQRYFHLHRNLFYVLDTEDSLLCCSRIVEVTFVLHAISVRLSIYFSFQFYNQLLYGSVYQVICDVMRQKIHSKFSGYILAKYLEINSSGESPPYLVIAHKYNRTFKKRMAHSQGNLDYP